MATTVKGLFILSRPTDQFQASFETAICLTELSGDNVGLAVADFCEDSVYADTVE